MNETIRLEPGTAALLDALHAAGYAAYAVGGCVRDSLLGLTPHDWDLCTSAQPTQGIALFGPAQCIPTGLKHGTVTVRHGGRLYEVTTFRTEGAYTDGRHPDTVRFVPDVRADLARRDFTINAMAYSAAEGLIDPFGGREDLRLGRVRAVGVPEQRFEEDGLRILRLYRFAARFGFAVDPATNAAARALAGRLRCVSAERVAAELACLLVAPKPGRCLEPEVFAVLLPELEPLHAPERFARLCALVDAVPPVLPLRWAALLSPLDGSAARDLLRRLRCPNALADAAALLVAERGLCPATDPAGRRVQALRLLGRLGPEPLAQLTALCAALRPAQKPALDALAAEAAALAAADACCRVNQLAVNGRDLLALGCAPGPGVRRALEALLEQVMTGQTPNDRAALLAATQRLASQKNPGNL